MLQTTVYLVNIITLGAVSHFLGVAIRCENKWIKGFGIVFWIIISRSSYWISKTLSVEANFHEKENSRYLTCQIYSCSISSLSLSP